MLIRVPYHPHLTHAHRREDGAFGWSALSAAAYDAQQLLQAGALPTARGADLIALSLIHRAWVRLLQAHQHAHAEAWAALLDDLRTRFGPEALEALEEAMRAIFDLPPSSEGGGSEGAEGLLPSPSGRGAGCEGQGHEDKALTSPPDGAAAPSTPSPLPEGEARGLRRAESGREGQGREDKALTSPPGGAVAPSTPSPLPEGEERGALPSPSGRGAGGEGQGREGASTAILPLRLLNENPAGRAYRPLFDEAPLAQTTAYPQLVDALEAGLRRLPGPPGAPETPLPDLLRAPLRAAPHDLAAQLRYIITHWAPWLGDELDAFRRGLDFWEESQRAVAFTSGPEQPPSPVWTGAEAAPEAYTPERAWMASLVLIVKHIPIWLAQLSRRYGRPITRLDQIPDEELARLASWGINGLWLLGIWERSPASQRIKHLTGNPQALGSAYAVRAYRVDPAWGGDEALDRLREQAARHGIRLGADMVPNHTALDAEWVLAHPDWYIQTDAPPFPGYRFSGPNLSPDPRADIRIEDGYYDRSDAAVVFRFEEKATGRVRYIYHGNDGTLVPWNDTAQLNHLLPEVRQALSETILEVARRFAVIRFDAAMTLTKRHYRRLWFPPPGEGGAIPSRAEHGLPAEAFDRAMPREFWREVVDRVNAEAPDTLLLAEAFWLLEGYFVRTLGMHRVYNSAFMHMLRDERNADYRRLLAETLAFDPRILGRYVNFMTTPDEDPAAAQFGKGDKYFAVATLMATLPGLPMFGHGQIEGLAEKYGHEFPAPQRDEAPDQGFLAHHERVIFPLLRRRALFAGVEGFRLFDFHTPAGVNEDVYAFTNRRGEERALVLVHNRAAHTQGRLYRSRPTRRVDLPDRPLKTATLAEALGLPAKPGAFVRFRVHPTGLEYLRPLASLHTHGLTWTLGPYQARVLWDWEVVDDPTGRWAQVYRALGDAGTPDLDALYREVALLPQAVAAFRAFWISEVARRFPDGPSPIPSAGLSARFSPSLPQGEEGGGEGAEGPLPSPPGRGAGGEGQGHEGKALTSPPGEADAPPIPSPLPEGEAKGGRTYPPQALIAKARALRRRMTDAEQLLWRLLRNRGVHGAKFRRQHPLGRYVVDFYCHEAKLAIELDGGHHATPSQRAYDQKRAADLERQGIQVLRFWNREVLQQTEAVLNAIWEALDARLPAAEGPTDASAPAFSEAPSPSSLGSEGPGDLAALPAPVRDLREAVGLSPEGAYATWAALTRLLDALAAPLPAPVEGGAEGKALTSPPGGAVAPPTPSPLPEGEAKGGRRAETRRESETLRTLVKGPWGEALAWHAALPEADAALRARVARAAGLDEEAQRRWAWLAALSQDQAPQPPPLPPHLAALGEALWRAWRKAA